MFQISSILHRLHTVNYHHINLNLIRCQLRHNFSRATLTQSGITELLSRNQIHIDKTNNNLPKYVKSIECNQLASNMPIEDRIRVSSVRIPGHEEPTLIMGVFDGHGGGTTADLISRRLFNYIALSLYPEPKKLEISDCGEFKNIIIDLHNSPNLINNNNSDHSHLSDAEFKSFLKFKNELNPEQDIVTKLKASFISCDNDLSEEICNNLINNKNTNQDSLHHYLSAAVSGCCAIVMVIHDGFAYLASSGDCRAVLGESTNPTLINDTNQDKSTGGDQKFKTNELNLEHNCDNINEIRRLAMSHPKREQNTIIKHNRLLGQLMPFRAFGDYNYKWSVDRIEACGLIKAYGSHIIPPNYETPPYLIVEPDVNPIQISTPKNIDENQQSYERFLVVGTDGLWELFESSREVVETVMDHCRNADDVIQNDFVEYDDDDNYDKNCATHVLRSALRSSSQDIGLNSGELKRIYHLRLESMLTLPQAIVRNFRDDISIIVLKL